MLDPLLSATLAIQSAKGAYALLLGSGVSRAAGIPTGWEITLDITTKVAALHNEDCSDNPEEWYHKTFHKEPDYAEVLEMVASSPTERMQRLRPYFEPTDDERDHGLKLPTKAHRAIASLVKSGHITVIITTNFDRLLEQSLQDEGIVPTVVATTDAIIGMTPLHLNRCTIVKAHGDYIDTRIKNTPAELSAYPNELNQLLDRIFDEYGLIVCGWSARYDTAMRAALERCNNHRFSTFWAWKSRLESEAVGLIALRRAQQIQIDSADQLFHETREKLEALDRLNPPHPISVQVATARVKKYIADDRHKIELSDLLMQSARALHSRIWDGSLPVDGKTEPEERLNQYEAFMEPMLSLIVQGCYWASEQHHKLLCDALPLVAYKPISPRDGSILLDLSGYPALLLLYAGGIAAIAAERYDTLASILGKAAITDPAGEDDRALGVALNSQRVLHPVNQKGLSRYGDLPSPLSWRIYDVLKETLASVVSSPTDYDRAFDRFEVLLALVYANLSYTKGSYDWFPTGRFVYGNRVRIIEQIHVELIKQQGSWPPFTAGLYGEGTNKAGAMLRALKTHVDTLQSQYGWS